MNYRNKILYTLGASFLIATVLYAGAVEGVVRKVGVNNFRVEIEGVTYAGIKELSGIESKTEEIFVLSDARSVANIPGTTKFGSIVLKRGFINDPALAEWRARIVAGEHERKSGSIVVLDRTGSEAMRYNFLEAWPCRWKAPELNSSSKVDFIEEIELCIGHWEQVVQ